MTHEEMVTLIQGGVPHTGGTWADFGAGTGNFTRALRTLIGPQATLYAVDQDAAALRAQQDAIPIHADFTQPLDLPPLDGLLIANALHWVRGQSAAMTHLVCCLRPGGRLLLVEYEAQRPRSFIPFPVPYTRFEALAQMAGLTGIQRVGTRTSPTSGMAMYAACGIRPGA